MATFAAVLLRGVLATFLGLLLAGGTLTLAADTVPVDRPTLVPVGPEQGTLTVPDVTGQPYVFAKSILQDHGLAWHVTGRVRGYAANLVAAQKPSSGTRVIDTGAPTVTLTLARNSKYGERGTPENDAPYRGTEIRIPATASDDERPRTSVVPHLEPVPIPVAPLAPGVRDQAPTPAPVSGPSATQTPLPAAPSTTTVPPVATAPTTLPTTPAPSASSGPRRPDFTAPGAPKEPASGASLPDRTAELRRWIESHREPTATNLNHWLYEHAFIVAGARFGWWHGAEALQALIEVDKRAEALWGVGDQSRTTAQKALAEVQARGA